MVNESGPGQGQPCSAQWASSAHWSSTLLIGGGAGGAEGVGVLRAKSSWSTRSRRRMRGRMSRSSKRNRKGRRSKSSWRSSSRSGAEGPWLSGGARGA